MREFILTVAYKVFPSGNFRDTAIFTFDDMGAGIEAYEHWVRQPTTITARLVDGLDGFIYRRYKR